VLYECALLVLIVASVLVWVKIGYLHSSDIYNRIQNIRIKIDR
jgi:hypothetical protein